MCDQRITINLFLIKSFEIEYVAYRNNLKKLIQVFCYVEYIDGRFIELQMK